MKVYRGLDSIEQPLRNIVLSIGNFDGVHRGHQQLLAEARRLGSQSKLPLAVMTLDPHPLAIIAPHRTPETLTPVEEKIRQLGAAGADIVVVTRSETALFQLTAEEFLDAIVCGKFQPAHVVEGPSFGFGRGRAGNPQMLREFGERRGFGVAIIEPVELPVEDGRPVMISSSLVRNLLRAGDVRKAAACLGRAYALLGTVTAGEQRGRELGFPTANLDVQGQLVPGEGVYAGIAEWEGGQYTAAVSIGRKETFGDHALTVEAHLLDADAGVDVRGRRLRLEFHERIRDQRRFESVQALIDRINEDIREIRTFFSDRKSS